MKEKESITELHGSSGIQEKPEAIGSNTTQLRLVLEGTLPSTVLKDNVLKPNLKQLQVLD